MSNTHNKVAHAWANQTGKNKSGFNMYYEGEYIYSYGQHFPIARITRDALGQRTTLLTTRRRSVSTAKHITITRRAIHGSYFEVDNVRASTEAEHALNWQDMVQEVQEALAKAKRARTYKDMHLRHAEERAAEATGYAIRFGLDRPPVDLEGIDATMAELRRHAAEQEAKARAERETRLRAQRREQRRLTNPRMVAWLDGAAHAPQFYGSNDSLRMRPFVRVVGDKVQTSWGAEVPKDAAITAFRMAAKCRALGRTWEAGRMSSPRIGDFALTKIGPTGNLVVGCHNIPYRHMKIAADRAGITLGEFGAWEAETVHPEVNALRNSKREG